MFKLLVTLLTLIMRFLYYIVCDRLGLAEAWGNLQSVRFNQDMSSFICAFQVGSLSLFTTFLFLTIIKQKFTKIIDPMKSQVKYSSIEFTNWLLPITNYTLLTM